MRDYHITTKKTWSQTQQELSDAFQRWGVRDTDWQTNYPRGARISGLNQSPEDRTVRLSYTKDGNTVNLEMGKQNRAVDNLRVLFLAIESMRMNELRGIAEVLQSAYLQLAAPESAMDPYEVLGLRPDVSLGVAEIVYKAKAREFHPDNKETGNTEFFKKVQQAIEIIRKEKS